MMVYKLLSLTMFKKYKLFITAILIFSISNFSFSKEKITLKWLELVPKYAYSFIPEEGVSEEMWEDEVFLKKVEQAGLAINEEVLGKKIRIDGFMVPLDFDYGEALTVEEFVLVPDAGMCIHVPPPPPNQMIFIKLTKPEKVRYMYQPIAVEGVLKKTPPIEEIYNSIYEMQAEFIEDIDFEELTY